MAEPNKMLEETANYLLNHCFVLGGVEDQRAKYLYVQDHLPKGTVVGFTLPAEEETILESEHFDR